MTEIATKAKPLYGRIYKIARNNAPTLLGARTCPNCRREKDIARFAKVKRGKGWGWLCDTCRNARKSPQRV